MASVNGSTATPRRSTRRARCLHSPHAEPAGSPGGCRPQGVGCEDLPDGPDPQRRPRRPRRIRQDVPGRGTALHHGCDRARRAGRGRHHRLRLRPGGGASSHLGVIGHRAVRGRRAQGERDRHARLRRLRRRRGGRAPRRRPGGVRRLRGRGRRGADRDRVAARRGTWDPPRDLREQARPGAGVVRAHARTAEGPLRPRRRTARAPDRRGSGVPRRHGSPRGHRHHLRIWFGRIWFGRIWFGRIWFGWI